MLILAPRESDFRFFHESIPLGPEYKPWGLFQIFMKIRGDIKNKRLITGVNDNNDDK
jgi:hypothetical protein